jgi:hypothetical protein
MATSVPKPPVSTRVNSSGRQLTAAGPSDDSELTAALGAIDRGRLASSIAINRPELSESDAVALAFDTFDAIGLLDKEAADLMHIDEGQLSRIKAGKGRLPFDALWRMPDRFWLEFRKRIDAARGFSDVSEEREFNRRIGELVTLLLNYRGAVRRQVTS